MKRRTTRKYLALFLAASLFTTVAAPRLVQGAEAPIDVGTTANFAILSGETITNIGSTEVTGDIGLYPGTEVTGDQSITLQGEWHLADAVAITAKDDLVTAYNDAAGRSPDIIPRELGGQTLTPGVYTSNEKDFLLTGTLVLDGQGDPDALFIFQTDTTLITASASSVVFMGGATACDVFWKVGSSATLGSNSSFAGSILALTSITLETGAQIRGQLLARNGSVTLESNRIISGPCAQEQSATLHVIKLIVDEHGGTAVPGDFTIHVQKDGTDVTGSPAPGLDAPGRAYTLVPGTYTVFEHPMEGYVASYSGDSTDGTIALAAGDEKTITITNTATTTAPGNGTGTIDLEKVDEEGNLLPGAQFTLYQNGVQVGEPLTTDENGTITFTGLPKGAYTLKETKAPEGYVLSGVVKDINIVEDNETVVVSFTNTRITGQINLLKLDAATGAFLAGAVFIITDSNGVEVFRDETDEDGMLFATLPYGTYMIEEITAPEGYVLSDAKYTVEITENGQVFNLEAENTKDTDTLTGDDKDSGPVLPPTGSASNTFFLMMGAFAITGGVLMMRKRTRV